MALPTNTFATYEAIGNREDLSDVIYRIDPTETPFMSGIEKEKAAAVNHEWQTQALAAVNTANAQLEGDDAVADAATATVRLGNICQISRKTPRVTGTQRAVEHAGRDDEMAYQEMLKGLELKRDMEAILCGTNQAKAAGNDTSARTTASVLSWIKTNTSKGSGGADPAAALGANTRTDGTQRVFTEANLKTVLQSVWNAGGKPDIIMTGGFNKQVFSTFTGRSSPIEDAKAKKITAAVDAYESDFGTRLATRCVIARHAGTKVTRSRRRADGSTAVPACDPQSTITSSPCAAMSISSVRAASPAGRRLPNIRKLRFASTSEPVAC
jgi:hypothetical protein